MQTPMTSFHLIPAWHEVTVNASDIMVTSFTLFVNLVTSHLACVLHAHKHGACALIKNGIQVTWHACKLTQT